jgi:hypothetical protein
MSEPGDGLHPGGDDSDEFEQAVGAANVGTSELREALLWVRKGRPPTVGEAREYFDAHAATGGDPETMDECERVLDALQRPTSGTGSGEDGPADSPYPKPTEEQIEEEGAD